MQQLTVILSKILQLLNKRVSFEKSTTARITEVMFISTNNVIVVNKTKTDA